MKEQQQPSDLVSVVGKTLDLIAPFISSVINHPEIFVFGDQLDQKDFIEVTKTLYDIAKQIEPRKTGSLKTLLTEGFDSEQIWEQLQLFSIPLIHYLEDKAKTLLKDPSIELIAKSKRKGQHFDESEEEDEDEEEEEENEDEEEDQFTEDEDGNLYEGHSGSDQEEGEENSEVKSDEEVDDKVEEEEEEEEEGEEGEGEGEDEDEENENGEEEDEESGNEENENGDEENEGEGEGEGEENENEADGDDDFFDMDEMERFVDEFDDEGEEDEEGEKYNEEEDEDDEDDAEDVYLNDLEDEDGELKYSDFFDPKSKKPKKKVEQEEEEGEDDEIVENDEEEKGEEENENETETNSEDNPFAKSPFSIRASRMKEKIAKLESKMLEDKKWMMLGEAGSADRPLNSLLEERLEFSHGSKVAPVITEEVTLNLETVIKKRILEGSWDDVVRKVLQTDDINYKPKIELDSTRNTEGLAKVYEDEFLRQQQTQSTVEVTTELEKTHKKIQKLFNELSSKLDALTSFHYTPKVKVKDIVIKSSVPAISMEEVLPTFASNESRVAPQELYKKKDRVVNRTELTPEERKAARRRHKEADKKHKLQTEEQKRKRAKVDPIFAAKLAQEKDIKELKENKKGVTLADNQKGKSTDFSNSSTFFEKLQKEVSLGISERKNEKSSQKKKETLSSSKLKL